MHDYVVPLVRLVLAIYAFINLPLLAVVKSVLPQLPPVQQIQAAVRAFSVGLFYVQMDLLDVGCQVMLVTALKVAELAGEGFNGTAVLAVGQPVATIRVFPFAPLAGIDLVDMIALNVDDQLMPAVVGLGARATAKHELRVAYLTRGCAVLRRFSFHVAGRTLGCDIAVYVYM